MGACLHEGDVWRERLMELNPEAVLFDGHDAAVIGIGSQYTGKVCAVYSEDKILEILARDIGMEGAEEYYEFNIACAWFGPSTPIIVALSEEMQGLT